MREPIRFYLTTFKKCNYALKSIDTCRVYSYLFVNLDIVFNGIFNSVELQGYQSMIDWKGRANDII